MSKRTAYAREVVVQLVLTAAAVAVSHATGHGWMPGLPIGVLLGLGIVTALSLRDRRRAERSLDTRPR
ncbi:hypothetical protein [Kineococcus arenarius]|uniref:hypothetical protein n=1 Tax=Kineococcus sp. SYSU DK007 TaxID=3383128 RepID=UPI003D7DB774